MEDNEENQRETGLTKPGRKTTPSRQDTIIANRALVSQIVAMGAEGLRKISSGEKVSLNDTDAVKEATARYMEQCARAGTMPGMAGLSAEIGYSRQNIYHDIKQNPSAETTKWLKACSDYFGEMMAAGALSGAVSAIPAIFTLKARFGWREEDEGMPKDSKPPEESPEEIASRWQDLPD